MERIRVEYISVWKHGRGKGISEVQEPCKLSVINRGLDHFPHIGQLAIESNGIWGQFTISLKITWFNSVELFYKIEVKCCPEVQCFNKTNLVKIFISILLRYQHLLSPYNTGDIIQMLSDPSSPFWVYCKPWNNGVTSWMWSPLSPFPLGAESPERRRDGEVTDHCKTQRASASLSCCDSAPAAGSRRQ